MDLSTYQPLRNGISARSSFVARNELHDGSAVALQSAATFAGALAEDTAVSETLKFVPKGTSGSIAQAVLEKNAFARSNAPSRSATVWTPAAPVGNTLDSIERWANCIDPHARLAVAASLESHAARDLRAVVRVREAAAVLRKGAASDSSVRSAEIKRNALQGLIHEQRSQATLSAAIVPIVRSRIAALTREIARTKISDSTTSESKSS